MQYSDQSDKNAAYQRGLHPRSDTLWSRFEARVSTDAGALTTTVSLAFCLKLILMIALAPKIINSDGVTFICAAQEMARGNWGASLDVYSRPLFPLVLHMAHWIIPDWVWAGRILSLLAIVGTLFPLYFLTKALFSQRAAFWACLAFAVAPMQQEWRRRFDSRRRASMMFENVLRRGIT